MLEQKNANEGIEPYGHIEGGDILNFTYYNLLPYLPFPCEKVGGAFFCSKSLSNTSRFYKSYIFSKVSFILCNFEHWVCALPSFCVFNLLSFCVIPSLYMG
jgi:hypothetical protein